MLSYNLYRSVCVVLISLSQAIEPYHRDCYACPVIRRTYGYIPGRRALSLFFGRYSFSVPLRVGSYFWPEYPVMYQDVVPANDHLSQYNRA